MSKNQTNELRASAPAVRKSWSTPSVRRLSAGSAEVGSNPVRTEGAFARGQS